MMANNRIPWGIPLVGSGLKAHFAILSFTKKKSNPVREEAAFVLATVKSITLVKVHISTVKKMPQTVLQECRK